MNLDENKISQRVAFYTLGCKVNHYETESIKNKLIKEGFSEVKFEEEADIYIVNSCTVTSIADKKTRNILRRAKKTNPLGLVIITGCYAETNQKDIITIPEVDFVIGNKDKHAISDFIITNKNMHLEEIKNETIFMEKEYQEYAFSDLRDMTRGYVKIQDGCNEFCSYCKIPFARGKSRSRKKEKIFEEIRALVDKGYKEIVLIGINLGAYGLDINNGKDIDFETLVAEIFEIPNLQRLRLGSIYPDKISEKFIELFKNEKLMPHLHISLQSGDDEVLKKMRRNYNGELIKQNLLELKKYVPNIEYTADVIVGFPGEDERMFKNSYDLIDEISISNLHIFQYSDREGTLASKMTNKVDPLIKRKRAETLEQLKKKMYNENRVKYKDICLEVLIEEQKDGYYIGYTGNYLKTKIKSDKDILNQIINVKIKRIEKGVLIGHEA